MNLLTKLKQKKNLSSIQGSVVSLFRSKQYSRGVLIVFVSLFAATGVALMMRSLAATSVAVTVDTNTVVGTSAMQTGVTHTQYDIYPHTNGTSAQALAAQDILKSSTNWQNQHIYGWGAGNPQPYKPTATSDNINWKDMDGRVSMMRKSGNPMIFTFCCSPDWMKGSPEGTTNWDNLSAAPLPEHVQDFANLTAKVAARYPDIKYFQVWNEMKGMYGLSTPGCSPAACGQNRHDYERYTTLYNAVWDAVKAVRPDAQIGGPYVVMDHWGSTSYSHPSGYPAQNRLGLPYYGDLDRRNFDVIKYWLKNKHGADFITLDGKLGNRDGTKLVDDFAAAQSWVDIADWVKALDPVEYPGKDLPLWWAEWYAQGNAKPADLNQNNAIMANSLIYTLKSGAVLPLVWDSNGDAQGNAFPVSLYTGVQDTGIGGAGVNGGKPTTYTPTSKGFKDYFQPGTQLTKVTVSDPTQVVALSSKTKILLVNKTAGDVVATVNGTNLNLSPYQVLFADIPTSSGGGGVIPPPPPPPAAVTLKLINADTDTVISPMTNGMTINLATARNLNIDATASVPIESVRFDEAGKPSITESFPPYAIGGDAGTNSTDYFPWTPTVGSHTMTVKAFSADAAGGTEVASTTINFTVIDSTPPSSGWELVYRDDFNTLNTSSTSPHSWSLYGGSGIYESGPGHGGNGLRSPRAFSVANGELVITAEMVDTNGDGTKDTIRSGGMSNRTNLAYGKYEVRARTEADPTGTMSGLALTWPQSGKWPADGELDWYETGTSVARNPIRSFFHWPCSEGACTFNADGSQKDIQDYATHSIDATQWHTYVMEWTPSSIKMFRDGQLIKMQTGADAITDPRKIPDVPHHVSLQLDALATRTLTQPVREYVDYVQVSKMSGTSSGADTTAPEVRWEAPTAGAIVSGQLTEADSNCRVSATDAGSGVERVEFFLDGTPVNTERAAPYNCFVIDTTKYPDGAHTLGAKAYDNSGNATGIVTQSVTFKNTTPGFQLLYEDNFDGTTLNTAAPDLSQQKSGWSPYGPYAGHGGNGIRTPTAIKVDGNGNLVIEGKMVNGVIESGGMSNKTATKYGKFETRVKTEVDPTGTMSGVILTWPFDNSSNLLNGENDFYETGHPSGTRTPFYSFIHYPNSISGGEQSRFVHNSDGTQWHKVVMEWAPIPSTNDEYINVKVYRDDGTLVSNNTIKESDDPTRENLPNIAHRLCIQLDAFQEVLPLTQPVKMMVDYARVYKYAATVSSDTTPPTTNITSPASNTPVTGIFTTTATATDPPATANGTGVSKVEFYMDKAGSTAVSPAKMTDSAVPYEYSVNTLDPALTNGNYVVTAKSYDAAGNSSTSNVTVNVNNADTTAPNAPTGLSATPASSTQVNLSWTASADTGANPSGVVKYNVLRRAPLEANYSVIAQVNAPATSYPNLGLTASSSYSYMVQAVDAVGNSSANSTAASTTTPATPDTTPPTTPTDLTATSTLSTQVDLSWTASTDTGGSGLRGYNVYRNGSTTPINGTTPITSTTYGDGTVVGSTDYTYQVEAVDGANPTNRSPKAGPVSVRTLAGPITINLLPTADTWISKKFADRAYGTTTQLKADVLPDQDTLIKFNVTGVGTKRVTSAKLNLYVAGSSDEGGIVYRLLGTNWNENTVTWNTAPSSDTVPLTNIGRVSGGSIVQIDLGSMITGDGTYALKISSTSKDTVVYNSKEASFSKPQLNITIE